MGLAIVFAYVVVTIVFLFAANLWGDAWGLLAALLWPLGLVILFGVWVRSRHREPSEPDTHYPDNLWECDLLIEGQEDDVRKMWIALVDRLQDDEGRTGVQFHSGGFKRYTPAVQGSASQEASDE